MDKQTAIDLLDNLLGMVEDNHESDYDTAIKMGIDALKDKMQLSEEDATFPVEGATLDCISRQQAILAIERNAYRHTYVDQIVDIIKWLPSVEELKSEAWDTAYLEGYTAGQNAQPKYVALHESCTDCPLYDRKNYNCPRFNRVIPMAIRDAQTQVKALSLPSVQPEQIARDIATIIENEKDMRVILQNTERTETHSCDYQRTETHEWIPVSEALPEDGVTVWVTIRGHDVITCEEGETLEQAIARISRIRWVTQGYWSEEEHGWNDPSFGCPLMVKPIAWMPIDTPEPYKGEQE